jgi:hypothetical protein
MNNFFKYFSAIGLAVYVMTGDAIGGELDGKRVICNLEQSPSRPAADIFLIFSGDNVTKLEISVRTEVNSDYQFLYNSVTMDETVSPVYINQVSVFWGNFIGRDFKPNPVTSRADALMAATLMRESGTWAHIDRNTLAAERGLSLQGQIFLQSGECKISDEAGEDTFYQNYHDWKSLADEELREKLEAAASSPPPKL